MTRNDRFLKKTLSKEQSYIKEKTKESNLILDKIKSINVKNLEIGAETNRSNNSKTVQMDPNLSFFSVATNSTVPNFIDSIFVKDKRKIEELLEKSYMNSSTKKLILDLPERSFSEADDQVIHLANNRQFAVVSQLFNEFYSIEEPSYEALQNY